LPHNSYDNSHNQGLQNELLGEWGEILKRLEVRVNIVQEKATVLEEAINKNSEKINNLENVLSITNSSFLNIIENQNEYNKRQTKRILNALKKWFITLLILIIICLLAILLISFFGYQVAKSSGSLNLFRLWRKGFRSNSGGGGD
jgi:hypothetical protein